MKSVIYSAILLSMTFCQIVEARQLSCRLDHQEMEGDYPQSLTFEIGNKFGGRFKSDGHTYDWTVLPDGYSMMTGDNDGFVYAAMYRCQVSR